MKELRVTVVGCGIAGAAVAAMLSRAGHHVTLLEQSQRVGPVGAGILLQPVGQAVLHDMGLLDAIASKAEPIRSIEADRLTDRGPRRLVRLPYDRHRPGLHALGTHRGDLFTELHRALVEGDVHLELGKRVDDIALLARDQNLVIIADGGKSELRNYVDTFGRVHEYPHGALWAVAKHNQVGGRLYQVARGTHTLCGLLPMGGGRCSLFWGLPLREQDALRNAGFDTWRAEVLRIMPAAAPLFEDVRSFDDLTLATYRHVHLRRWHRDNVVVLGDAAHAMSPHLGQGVNLALCDAAQLASSLAEHDHDVAAALPHYENRRRRQLRWYSFITKTLSPFFQGERNWLAWPRDRTLPWLTKVPVVDRIMVKTLAGEALL